MANKNRIKAKKLAKNIINEIKLELSMNLYSGNYNVNILKCKKLHELSKLAKTAFKTICASKNYRIYYNTIYDQYSNHVNAFSMWVGTIKTLILNKSYRHKILLILYKRKYYIFAIPVTMVHTSFKLATLDFANNETELLINIANTVSHHTENIEIDFELKHPAKDSIVCQTNRFKHEINNEMFLKILKENHYLLDYIVPTLDVQLRSFKNLKYAPLGIYNFTTSNHDVQAITQFKNILTATNFVYSHKYANSKPIEVNLTDSIDNLFGKYSDNIVLALVVHDSSALKKLSDVIGRREQQRTIGKILDSRLPTVPILLNRKLVADINAINIEIAKTKQLLTDDELNLIRATCKQVLNKKTADEVYKMWKKTMDDPFSYNVLVFNAWVDSIKSVFLNTIAGDDKNLNSIVQNILGNIQSQQQAKNSKIKQQIQNAIDTIRNYEKFKNKIIERPSSVQIANDKLSDEAYAFWFSPQKGDDCGSKFLAFNKNSLLRLLKSTGFDESLYDVFIKEATDVGILQSPNRSINLSNRTFNAITFYT